MVKKTKQSLQGLGIIIIVLLALNLAFNVIDFFGEEENSTLAIEQLKAGGEENFGIMKQIFESPTYQAQQKANLLQTLESFGGEIAQEQETKEDTNVEVTNDDDMIKTFKEITDDAHIVGNKDARFTIIEYSELFCPYCRRQHNDGNIDSVIETFDGQVNATFRNFIVHPAAKRYAEAGECIADIEGEKAYNEYIDAAFKLDSAINDDALATIIKDNKRNSKKINACIDKGEFSNKIDTQTSEGRTLFAVKGTPGNVIIDHETGRFILIPGAYPAEKFIEEINNLMK